MLVDVVELTVNGGHGGPGKASFFKKGVGPDGGNGGNGGDVYFLTTSDLTVLNRYVNKKILSGIDGEAGGSNRKSGHNAPDTTFLVPSGCEVFDLETEEVIFLSKPAEKILICRGGLGGLGNADRRSARMTTPLKAQTGLPGQRRQLRIQLKLIADFGLIGLPNAGKSSLLNALTNAGAKVADYPFTTLEPNLGVRDGKILADIPGLIVGASSGKGLGFQFLKHVEKVPILIHCVASDSSDPKKDYQTVRSELKKYNPELMNKKEIIVRTKSDICQPKGLRGLAVSIIDDDSINKLWTKLSLP